MRSIFYLLRKPVTFYYGQRGNCETIEKSGQALSLHLNGHSNLLYAHIFKALNDEGLLVPGFFARKIDPNGYVLPREEAEADSKDKVLNVEVRGEC